MQRLRKIIFWCHLAAGVTAGIVILIMSVTGVLLTYERQITRWADVRDYRAAPSASDAVRLPVSTLVARAREAKPDTAPTAVTFRSDPTAPVEIVFGREGTLFVNGYTGVVYGEGAKGVRSFFRTVTDLHRWLAVPSESRAVGKAITGACNLLFLFIVASGFYLWFPRRLTWQQIRNVIWFRRGVGGKARDFNWHNVVGFWSAIPLFIVVLSAVVISYPWASDLVYRVVGEQPPARQQNAGGGQSRGSSQQSADAVDRLFPRAAGQAADWRSIQVQLPTTPDAPVQFTIDRGDGGQPHLRAQLVLNPANGEIVRWELFAAQTPGRRLRSVLRFAHTGEVAGIVGQTIAGVVSAGGALLVWTGLALSWRRLRAWRARRARPTETLEQSELA